MNVVYKSPTAIKVVILLGISKWTTYPCMSEILSGTISLMWSENLEAILDTRVSYFYVPLKIGVLNNWRNIKYTIINF